MEIKVTQLQRRGTHVMFRVFIEGITGATRRKEIMHRKKGSHTPQIVGWEDTKERIPHTWAYVDGHWNGEKLILNPVEFSKSVKWIDAESFRGNVMGVVEFSDQYQRVIKTLRKL